MDVLRSILKWVRTHRIITALLVLLLAGGAIGSNYVMARSDGTLSPPLSRGRVAQSVYGIGTVMATKSFQIKLGVVSTLDGVYVKEGDIVTRGARLVTIDGVSYRAPFPGTVTSLPFKIGENVYAQAPVLTLVDLSDRYLVVSLEQQGALQVKVGQNVKISFDSLREQAFEGRVLAVYSSDNSFLARIDVAKLPPQVLPGMTADVAITIRELNDALLVPVAALEKGHSLWVKRGNSIPTQVDVKIGVIDDEQAEVVAGDLAAGDRVLIRRSLTK